MTSVHAHAARLSDPQARVAHETEGSSRSTKRAIRHRRQDRRAEDARRARRSISRSCGTGHDHVAQRRAEESVRDRTASVAGRATPADSQSSIGRFKPLSAALMARRPRELVCVVDAFAPRAGGAGAARTEAHRSLPADRHPVEPLEGSEEEDRLAALSRLLLRALQSARAAADSEVHRRREHRFVRRRAGADSRASRSTASAGSSRAISRTIPVR